MYKDFDTWNNRKKELHASFKIPAFYNREVWWAKIGTNVGSEMDGKHELFMRPVIIIRKFNLEMALIIPSTSQDKSGKYYVDVSGEDGKTYKPCVSQIRVISVKRLFRKIGMIKKEDYSNLLKKISDMVYGRL